VHTYVDAITRPNAENFLTTKQPRKYAAALKIYGRKIWPAGIALDCKKLLFFSSEKVNEL
jgi:hypothetical protein